MQDTLYMEAYYGKLPEFEQIEACFASIIKKARTEKYKSNPNTYPETKKIQKLFAKVFGLKKMIFYWVPSDINNAYTVTLYSMMLFGESEDFIEKRTDRGFYDTSGKSMFTVYAYTGILSKQTNLTAGELTAILLHEFGHNFDYSRYHMISFVLDLLTNPMLAIYTQTHKNIEDHNEVKEEYYKQTKKQWDPLYKSESKRKKEAEKYKKNLKKALNKGMFTQTVKFLLQTSLFPIYLVMALPIQLTSLDGKKGELFADSFATSYGYGPDLISGLEKLSDLSYVKIDKHSKGLDVMRDLNTAMDEMFIGMYEIHGTNQERCRETIKKLEADIKAGDYPPELKEDLYNELTKVRERYNYMLSLEGSNNNKILSFWRKLCNTIFGGAPNIAKIFKPNRV